MTVSANGQQVHEIAKMYRVPAKHVLSLLAQMGVPKRSASSQIAKADVEGLAAAHGAELEEFGLARAAEAAARNSAAAVLAVARPSRPTNAGGSKVSSKKSTRTTPTTGQKSQEVPAEKSTAKRTAGREKNGQ